MPEGKLLCSYNNGCYKWYQGDGHNKKYIPKQNRSLAEQLAYKKYLSLVLEELETELLSTQSYFQSCSSLSKSQQLLSSPEYQKLLSSYFTTESLDAVEWMNEPYERNTYAIERCIHKSVSGNLVRSKSEELIDMSLFTHKIPFRYECALRLGANVIYPDFTIFHPVTKKIFYWEHFGMMDVPEYAQKTCSKLQLYISHNIIPSIHLITTYETMDSPINSNIIENIISQYFL